MPHKVLSLVAKRRKLADAAKRIGGVDGIVAVSEGLDELKTRRKVLGKQLKAVLSLIPLAEKVYRKWSSQSNAYALTNLLTQSTSIMEDIEKIDKSKLVDKVIENILDPMMEAFIRDVSTELYDLKKSIEDVVEPRHRTFVSRQIKGSLSRFGSRGRDIYSRVKEDVRLQLK